MQQRDDLVVFRHFVIKFSLHDHEVVAILGLC